MKVHLKALCTRQFVTWTTRKKKSNLSLSIRPAQAMPLAEVETESDVPAAAARDEAKRQGRDMRSSDSIRLRLDRRLDRNDVIICQNLC
jgi:hypothetical protein